MVLSSGLDSSSGAGSSAAGSPPSTGATIWSSLTSPSSIFPSIFLASALSDPQFLAPPPPFLISFPLPVPLRRSYARFPSLGGLRPPRPCFVLRSLLDRRLLTAELESGLLEFFGSR